MAILGARLRTHRPFNKVRQCPLRLVGPCFLAFWLFGNVHLNSLTSPTSGGMIGGTSEVSGVDLVPILTYFHEGGFMATNFLSDAYLKNLQYTGQQKIADGGGLYIFLTPNGSKLWRMKYRFNGKEKTLSFGPYPLVSLSEAREKRDTAKKLLLQKMDPGEKKKEDAAEVQRKEDSFECVGREWFGKNLDALMETTRNRIIKNLGKDVFPYIGNIPVSELTAKNVLQVCLHVEARGASEIAHRILRDCGRKCVMPLPRTELNMILPCI